MSSSNNIQKPVPISILKTSDSVQISGKTAHFVLSEDEEEEYNTKHNSDNDIDDDEPATEPMSAEALELLETEKVLKAGYLNKKGEKRRTWKKRWFVLRTTKLAMYKDEKEYKLLRIIDLEEIDQVLKTKHKVKKNVFGISTVKRIYYVQADKPEDMDNWLYLINQAKKEHALYDFDHEYDPNYTIKPNRSSESMRQPNIIDNRISSEPINIRKPQRLELNDCEFSPPDQVTRTNIIDGIASSEDDEEYSADKANVEWEESKNRVITESYLLKLGRNKGWRKRWFVLRADALSYYEDEKEYSPHRIIPLKDIADFVKIDPVSKSKQFCFKIVIPKRSYVLCASTEEDVDNWLNKLRAAHSNDKNEDKSGTPNTPHPHNNVTSYSLQKVTSTHSSSSSFENTSHLSGMSGAGGVGGAGGALGGAPNPSINIFHPRLGLTQTQQ